MCTGYTSHVKIIIGKKITSKPQISAERARGTFVNKIINTMAKQAKH